MQTKLFTMHSKVSEEFESNYKNFYRDDREKLRNLQYTKQKITKENFSKYIAYDVCKVLYHKKIDTPSEFVDALRVYFASQFIACHKVLPFIFRVLGVNHNGYFATEASAAKELKEMMLYTLKNQEDVKKLMRDKGIDHTNEEFDDMFEELAYDCVKSYKRAMYFGLMESFHPWTLKSFMSFTMLCTTAFIIVVATCSYAFNLPVISLISNIVAGSERAV